MQLAWTLVGLVAGVGTVVALVVAIYIEVVFGPVRSYDEQQ